MDPSNTPLRLLVVGSDDFPYKNILGEALGVWWVSNDRPTAELVVEVSTVGFDAARVWNMRRFPIHQHPAPLDNPLEEAYRREVMLVGVTHAIVLETSTQPLDWVDDLRAAGIPFTLVSLRHG